MMRMSGMALAAFGATAGAWTIGSGGTDARGATAPQTDARVELGRRLFFDPAVSRTGRVSCASCHDPDHGFTDRSNPSQDEFGPMDRRSMPVTDLAAGPMHSDGEFAGVRELLAARLVPFDDLEHDRRIATLGRFGLHFDAYGTPDGPKPGLVPVAHRVAQDGFYAAAFAAAFGDPKPTIDRVMDAVYEYVSSLRTEPSPFDRFVAGDRDALAPAARRGLDLYAGKADCAKCHPTTTVNGRASLRDERFHDIGISWRTAVARGAEHPARDADQGQGAHGRREADRQSGAMRFKTPSLRDVARRGPYMHDGSLATLDDVIAYFDRGGARHPGLDPAMRPLNLTQDEKDDLLAFLLALSGPGRAGLAPPSQWTGRTTTVRLVEPDGTPIAGAAVGVEPAGDRFRGNDADVSPAALRTDAQGRVTFAFPRSTHVRIRVEGHGDGGGSRLVPDSAGDVEMIAVPRDVVAIRVECDGSGLPREIRADPDSRVDALTRPVARREGNSFVFSLARELSKSEGVYVARVPRTTTGNRRRVLVPREDDGGATTSQVDVDLTGGALTSVDLRPPKALAAEARETSARR